MTSNAREPRSNGQWAVDGHAPLNPNEEFKAVENPLTIRQRVEQVYSREGFDAISADDLHGRLRWWGLYTQRRQDIDGSRTSSLIAGSFRPSSPLPDRRFPRPWHS